MNYISFGKINKKFFIPIIGGVVRLIYAFLIILNPKYGAALENPFILSIYTNIGMICAFIPYLILKYRSKRSNIISKDLKYKSKLNLELIHNDIFDETRCNKYKFIALSTIFDFFEIVITYLFCMNCAYNLWIFDIIFISLFSYLILKTKYYKHQYFSMIIILLLGLILNFLEYFKSVESEDRLNFFEILMKLLSEISLSLSVVIIKYNMEKNYCSPYEVCIWEGILGLILHIICLAIINALEVKIDDIQYPDNFFKYLENYDIYDFVVCFMVIIVNFIYNISIMIACDSFTPVHILITYIIKEYYYYLKINENIALNFLGILTLIFISFMFLVFVEIIELNIFSISYNTKKNIEIRSEMDSFVDINAILGQNEEVKHDEEDLMNSSFSSASDNP